MGLARFIIGLLEAFDRHGDSPAIEGKHPLSYRELLALVYRLARGLDRFGLRRGDGLALMSGNRYESVAVRLAAHVLGLRNVDMPRSWPAQRIVDVLDAAETVAVVYDPHRGAPPAGGRPLLSLGTGGFDLLAAAATEPDEPVEVRAQETDIAHLLYTSGTTGEPKGVENTFSLLAAEADEWDRQEWPALDGVRFLTVTPFAHAAGGITVSMLRRGIPVELLPDIDVEAILTAIGRSGPVLTYLYPSLLCQLLDHPATQHGIPGLASVIYGSAPMSPSRLADAIARCGPIFRQWYALQEVAPVARLSVRDHITGGRLLSSVGRPIPEVELTIRDSRDRPLPAGEIGEVCVRSAHVTSGYWRRPDLTAQAIRDGVLHTGDLGYLDQHGYLYLVGRLSEKIIINSEDCYALPIEAVLTSHPGVSQAAVVGVPSDITGEAIHAFLVPAHDSTLDITELREYATRQLSRDELPEAFHIIEAIPLTPLNKPDKKALRDALTSQRP